MTVGEVVDILLQVDRDRTIYVPDLTDQTAQPVAAVVDMVHLNLPKGIAIPDDVALLPSRMLNDGGEEVEADEPVPTP